MKTIPLFRAAICLTFLCMSTFAFSQVPQGFNYQAVLRDQNGDILANQAVTLRFTIHDATVGGAVLYKETRAVVTSSEGVINTVIGTGTVVSGVFADIDWPYNLRFLQVEVNVTGSYIDLGTQQFVSVPFALFAKTAATIQDITLNDLNDVEAFNLSEGDILTYDETEGWWTGGSLSNSAWSLEGNANTNSTTNFIGTTDDRPLNFRVNNAAAGTINRSFHTVCFGDQAGNSLTNQVQNTFIGSKCGMNSSGGLNTGLGAYALMNSEGACNTAVGTSVLNGTTTGSGNTAMGCVAMESNTMGFENTAIGFYSIHDNTTGYANSALGTYSLYKTTTGNENTAVGGYTLFNNTDGFDNTAIGFFSLFSNKAGSYGTAIGYNAMKYANNTTTPFLNYNVAVGYEALRGSTSASDNTGNWNTALGSMALQNNTLGIDNTATGSNALSINTSGSNNTAAGYQSQFTNTSGVSNTAIGMNSMYFNATGMNNTAVGRSAYFDLDNLNNTGCFGHTAGGESDVSNRIEIGNTSVSWIGGQVAWSTYSDGRIKEHIEANVPGLSFITRLRPVTYNLNIHRQEELVHGADRDTTNWDTKYDIEKVRMSGFIAQEVEEAAKAANYDFSGLEVPNDQGKTLYSLRYSDFVVPLVQSVQELDQKINELHDQSQNTAVQAESQKLAERLEAQQAEIAALRAELAELKKLFIASPQ